LSPETHENISLILNLVVVQGYGLTESTAGATVMDEFDLTLGRSGVPLTTNLIRLVNWEEGNYFVTNKPYPQGEVLIGGDNVAVGYFKMPKETEEAFFDEDGVRWLRTGDIGEIHEDGCLKIIGRPRTLVCQS
jgi:long-chain acyl-CoA synthetase